MNYKSLLCAATLLAASGMAQAFPTYEFSPNNSEAITSLSTASTLKLVFAWDFEYDYTLTVVKPTAAVFMNNATGQEVNSDNIFMETGSTLAIHFDSDKIAEYGDGEWTLAIPAGTFTVSTTEDTYATEILVNEPNPAASIQYTLNISNAGNEEPEVVYTPIEFKSADPASGSKLVSWGNGSEGDMMKVKLVTSDDAAVNAISWYLYDVTGEEAEYVRQGDDNRYDWNRYGGSMDDQWADGLFIAVGGETPLVDGHKYRVDLAFYALGNDPVKMSGVHPQDQAKSLICEATLNYEGLTKPEEYSEVKYVSVTPDPENYVIDSVDLAFFDIQFSGLVKPEVFNYNNGPGMQGAAGTWEPYEDTEVVNGYASRWTFKFSESLVESAVGTLSTYVTAKDRDGLYVKAGNADVDFGDYYYNMVWKCNCGAPDLLSLYPTPFTEVESLSSITISNDKDGVIYTMAVSYNSTTGVEIRNLDGAIIRELGEPEFSDDLTTATWEFEPITENGRYVLMIPDKYFALGEQFDGSMSNATSFSYIVDNGASSDGVVYDLAPASINPADGSNVESISDVVLTFEDITFYPMDGSAPNIQLYKKEGPNMTLMQTLDVTVESQVGYNDYNEPTVYTLKFETVEEDGTYQIFIPQGVFCDETYDVEMGEAGRANGDIYITYVIGEGNPDEPVVGEVVYDIKPSAITPENNTTVTEIKDINIKFAEAVYSIWYSDASGLSAPKNVILYAVSESGEEMVQASPVMDDFTNPDYDFMNPTLYVVNFDAVSADGQYKVVIPEGTFGTLACLNSVDAGDGLSDRANPEITLYYAIGQAVGVESIVDGAELINVYDVNGVQVLKDAPVEAAKELKSGLYIINGKKVMIRR